MILRLLLVLLICVIAAATSFYATLRYLDSPSMSPRETLVRIVGDSFNLSLKPAPSVDLRGKTILVKASIKTGTKQKFRIGVFDVVGSDYANSSSEYHSGNDSWQVLVVTHKVRSSANDVVVRLIQADNSGTQDSVYARDILVIVDGLAFPVDFDGLVRFARKTDRNEGWFFDGGTAKLSVVN